MSRNKRKPNADQTERQIRGRKKIWGHRRPTEQQKPGDKRKKKKKTCLETNETNWRETRPEEADTATDAGRQMKGNEGRWGRRRRTQHPRLRRTHLIVVRTPTVNSLCSNGLPFPAKQVKDSGQKVYCCIWVATVTTQTPLFDSLSTCA